MSIPEEKLLPIPWWFRPFPHPGDPIDMEFVLRDLEEPLRNRLVAARLDAIAKVHGNIADMHRNIADGATNMSKILTARAGK